MKEIILLILLIHRGLGASDPTTCMTDFEENDELHFVCFCHDNFEDRIEEQAQEIAQHRGFSLAHFAYNLAGSYFGKSVHIVFQSCRHLKLVLDHSELSRIGSDLFRPDIQVRELKIGQYLSQNWFKLVYTNENIFQTSVTARKTHEIRLEF